MLEIKKFILDIRVETGHIGYISDVEGHSIVHMVESKWTIL